MRCEINLKTIAVLKTIRTSRYFIVITIPQYDDIVIVLGKYNTADDTLSPPPLPPPYTINAIPVFHGCPRSSQVEEQCIITRLTVVVVTIAVNIANARGLTTPVFSERFRAKRNVMLLSSSSGGGGGHTVYE